MLALSQPKEVLARVRGAVAGAGIAVGLVVVVCGYPLWRQFHGPLAEHGSPWHPGKYGNHLASFVTAPQAVLLDSPARFQDYLVATGQFPLEVYAYLGWPLVAAVIAITIGFWRDVRIRVCGLSFFSLEWLSMGGHRQRVLGSSVPAAWFPWHYLERLPVLNEIIVTRLSILADGLCAATLALAAAKIITVLRSEEGRRRPALASAAVVAVAAMVVPLIPRPLPVRTVIPPPPGWQAVLSRLDLPANAPILVLPFDSGTTMEWQATSSAPVSIVGGWCVVPDPTGLATACDSKAVQTPAERTTYLRTTWLATDPGRPGPAFATTELALTQWHAAAVLVTPGADPGLASYLTALLGKPTAHHGGLAGWRLIRPWQRPRKGQSLASAARRQRARLPGLRAGGGK
jgi:hypothetical protein